MLKSFKIPCESMGDNYPYMIGNVEKGTPRKNRVLKFLIMSEENEGANC